MQDRQADADARDADMFRQADLRGDLARCEVCGEICTLTTNIIQACDDCKEGDEYAEIFDRAMMEIADAMSGY